MRLTLRPPSSGRQLAGGSEYGLCYTEHMPIASGSFEITSTPEPPFDSTNNVLLGRMTFVKEFQGPLVGSSTVHMTYARTPKDSSAGYVAVEKITGTLEERSGSFVVMHTGVTADGNLDLTIAIVPDSGTGDLTGVSGSMTIENNDGAHTYTLNYQLP